MSFSLNNKEGIRDLSSTLQLFSMARKHALLVEQDVWKNLLKENVHHESSFESSFSTTSIAGEVNIY